MVVPNGTASRRASYGYDGDISSGQETPEAKHSLTAYVVTKKRDVPNVVANVHNINRLWGRVTMNLHESAEGSNDAPGLVA